MCEPGGVCTARGAAAGKQMHDAFLHSAVKLLATLRKTVVGIKVKMC